MICELQPIQFDSLIAASKINSFSKHRQCLFQGNTIELIERPLWVESDKGCYRQEADFEPFPILVSSCIKKLGNAPLVNQTSGTTSSIFTQVFSIASIPSCDFGKFCWDIVGRLPAI